MRRFGPMLAAAAIGASALFAAPALAESQPPATTPHEPLNDPSRTAPVPVWATLDKWDTWERREQADKWLDWYKWRAYWQLKAELEAELRQQAPQGL